MNEIYIQLIATILTIFLFIGGFVFILINQTKKQYHKYNCIKNDIDHIKSDIKELNYEIYVLSEKLDQLTEAVAVLSKEFAYFRGFVEGVLYTNIKE